MKSSFLAKYELTSDALKIVPNSVMFYHCLSDPLFPSVLVMLCSPFFHFSKQKVFNLYFLQFLKERKAFSFETKTEGFHKLWKQNYASVSFNQGQVRVGLELGQGWEEVWKGLGRGWEGVGFELGEVSLQSNTIQLQ